MTIDELVNQYKENAEDIFKNHGHNPEKEENVKKRLEMLQK